MNDETKGRIEALSNPVSNEEANKSQQKALKLTPKPSKVKKATQRTKGGEIRTKSGKTKCVLLSRAKAIKAMCSECMGWESHPNDCTSKLCPLYPYRGRSLIAYD